MPDAAVILKQVAIIVTTALLGVTAPQAAMANVVARAHLVADGQRVELVERRLEGGALERTFEAMAG